MMISGTEVRIIVFSKDKEIIEIRIKECGSIVVILE